MIDHEQLALLIYQHAVQLTLIDYEVEQAFRLAHQVAAAAFDEAFTRDGLAQAAEARRKKPRMGQAAPSETRTPPPGPGR